MNDGQCKIFIESLSVKIDLEMHRVLIRDDILEFFQTVFCEIRAISERKVCEFLVFLECLSDHRHSHRESLWQIRS